MYKLVIGIDPGLEGAVALINEQGLECIELLKTVNPRWLTARLTDNRQHTIVVIEKSQSMPGQGIAAMFNYGVGFGKLQGWCEALEVPFVLVPPRTWQQELHKGCTGTTAKVKSHQAAKRLYPGTSFKATALSRRDHDGLMDALLIAEYGRRTYLR